MRIAILEPYIGVIGGAQKVIAKYALYLSSKGHEVEIFTQRKTESSYKYFQNIKINLLAPHSTILSPFAFLKKFNGFDLIISNDWPTHFSSLRNKNVAWICYSPKRDFYDLKEYYIKNSNFKNKIILSLKNLLFKKIDYIAAKKCKEIFPISKSIQKRIKMYYNLNAPKKFYCGIDYSKYKTGLFEKYLFTVSRFVKPKRVDEIIKAMRLLKNKNIKLLIAGDGPEKESLLKLAGKNSHIKFLGQVDEKKLISCYSNCLAVIFVPKNEDWGLITLEAMASGKPVIGANEGGIREILENNKTGFLLDEISPEKIAEKINYLIDNEQVAKKMGKQAKKRAKQFDWEDLLSKFEKHLIKNIKD